MLRASLLALVLVWIVPFAGSGIPLAAAQDAAFTVITHPDAQGTGISRAVLSSVFLRDVEHWGNGKEIHPVDRSLTSEFRKAFTREVLTVPAQGLQRYWASRIMNGVRPPMVKETDEQVLEYVARTKGAVGYVSADVTLPAGVKALTIID